MIPVELERALEGVRQRIRRMIEIRRYEPLSETDEDVFRDLLDREEQLLRLVRQYPDWAQPNDSLPVAMPEAI